MHNKTNGLIKTAAVMAALAGVTSAHGQSSDALIDKLVDKGILTAKEANELREEADKGFTQAYQVKSGMPDWVTALRFNGDFRGRYDGIYNPENAPGLPAATIIDDRHRFRYRLRFGAIATLRDNFEVGLRLTSSDSPTGFTTGDPISGNSSFSDNGSKKMIYIDQAYAKWTALNTPTLFASTTVGKMENPFVFSEMVFDADYTPEGAAINLAYNLTDTQSLKFNGGGFMLDELGNDDNDPFLAGAQIRWDANWTPKLQTSAGAALLSIVNAREGLASAAVPDLNSGNSRQIAAGGGFPANSLLNTFTTFVADASVTYNIEGVPLYNAPFPIRVGGEFMENLVAEDRNQGYAIGITFGKSGKKGLWEISYKWKELQGDVWYEEMVDSDFGGFYQVAPPGGSPTTVSSAGIGYKAGTNLRGHVIRAQYSFFDSFTLGGTVYIADVIDTPTGASPVTPEYDSQSMRVQVDAVWKF